MAEAVEAQTQHSEPTETRCTRPVRVIDRTTGEEVELVPIKVWMLAPRGRKGVKIGLFKSPKTGKYFRSKVPDDYPICG